VHRPCWRLDGKYYPTGRDQHSQPDGHLWFQQPSSFVGLPTCPARWLGLNVRGPFATRVRRVGHRCSRDWTRAPGFRCDRIPTIIGPTVWHGMTAGRYPRCLLSAEQYCPPGEQSPRRAWPLGSPTSSEENDPLAIVVETAKNTGRGAVSL